MSNLKLNLKTCLTLVALLALAAMLAGCDSDSTAPQDEIPTLTQDGAAQQAAIVAMAVASAAPEIVNYDDAGKEMYSYTFSGAQGITGTVNLEYWLGGADGTSATFATGDYARLWTPEPEGITGTISTGGSVTVTFDIEAEVVQASSTATIQVGSTGTFVSGDYSGTFDVNNLVVTAAAYPSSGAVVFSSGGHVITITYSGGNTATLSVSGVDTWTVNLDDGTLFEIN